VATRPDDPLERLRRDDQTTIAGMVELVKTYAQQQTVDPIKGAGRWMGYAAGGAVVLAIGLGIVLLGLLRLLQFEWPRSASGSLSWVSYAVVLVVSVIIVVIAAQRIGASPKGGADDTDKETI
jgi:uncharacterized membrane protein YidH (DUF202 family)